MAKQTDIFFGQYFAVPTTLGTEIVPLRECLWLMPVAAEGLDNYVEGHLIDPDEVIDIQSGWIGRTYDTSTFKSSNFTIYESESRAREVLENGAPDLEGYAQRRIFLEFVPQIYKNERDDYPVELDPVRFDATDAVLNLSLEEINSLINDRLDPNDVDNLVPSKIRNEHGGPFDVRGLEMVANYFDVDRFDGEVTPEQYETARQAHKIGQEKTYYVMVERTETRHVWIEVTANSEFEAETAALSKAGDIDFYSEGIASDPVYQVSELADSVREDKPLRQTYRPRH